MTETESLIERKREDLVRLKRNLEDDAMNVRRQNAEKIVLKEEASIAKQIVHLQEELILQESERDENDGV